MSTLVCVLGGAIGTSAFALFYFRRVRMERLATGTFNGVEFLASEDVVRREPATAPSPTAAGRRPPVHLSRPPTGLKADRMLAEC